LTNIVCHFVSAHLLYYCGPFGRPPTLMVEYRQEVTNNSCQLNYVFCMYPQFT